MSLLDDIPEGVVVGLDTAPLIYYFEDHPDYEPIVAPLFEARLEHGKNLGTTSVVSLIETLVQPLKNGLHALAITYRDFLTGDPYLDLRAITAPLAERAADFRARYGLRLADACQLAAALEAKATVFLTNDTKFRRVTELTVLILDDYLTPPAPPAAAAVPVP